MSVIVSNIGSLSLKAQGDISPSRFVKLAATFDHSALQAGADEETIGISQAGTKAAPIPGASTLAAASGDGIMCFGAGDVCLLELGGTVARADDLKPDANGKGVTVTSGHAGAQALESGVSGELIKVKVRQIKL